MTFRFIFIVMFVSIIMVLMGTTEKANSVFEFSQLQSNQYIIINDGVMGGRSRSQVESTDEAAVYTGQVSLDNNGGFASVRMIWPAVFAKHPVEASRLALRVKGDGLTYQFRLRTNRGFDGAAYSHSFTTEQGQLQSIEMALNDFTPTYRGRVLSDMPDLKFSDVQQMGLLIADKQVGEFSIELIDLILH